MSIIVGDRYIIEREIGHGGMGKVSLATDRLTGDTLALKQILVSNDRIMYKSRGSHQTTDSDIRLGLAQEFRTLASLRHPHIIGVMDYGFDDDGKPYYTMPYLSDISTILEFARLGDTYDKIRLLRQLLEAITYLHHRGILHRDLKPDNILVAEDTTIRVMDFGLARTQSDIAHSASDPTTNLTGTLAYMSPEQFQGKRQSTASDLYAIGMIAYQLFVGKHPFETKNVTKLIHQHLGTIPDCSSIEDKQLQEIISRLLSKDPLDRYPSAYAVLQALAKAGHITLTGDTEEVRESYLQTSQFSGRNQELQQLYSDFESASKGQGNGWLIGGVSGVGKSRLIEEFRIRALTSGALVLVGQAVEGGGLPYQLWRDPLKRLALSVEIDDLDAATVKPLIPNIEDLLGYDVPDAPQLDGNNARQRISLAIARIFNDYQRPMVLILEDLHWTSESIAPLQALMRNITNLPLLIVATYRRDEAPDLPAQLPEMQTMTLNRLDQTAIREMSKAMLGDTGENPEIINLLERESEGNAFFMVEIVRALAEDVGFLHEIGNRTLPQSVIAGGIEKILERRIARIPESDQEILRMSAVIGRQIDTEILREIFNLEPHELQSWLNACADAALLEVKDNIWRFTHDKIRESILRHLKDDEAKTLHQQVAEAIETVYADRLDNYADVLMQHWRIAGNLDKDLHYAHITSKRWVELEGRHTDATSVLYYILRNADPDKHNEKIAWAHYLLGESSRATGQYDRAKEFFADSLAVSEQIEQQQLIAENLFSLGRIHGMQGEFDTATEYLNRSMDYAKETDNQAIQAGTLRIIGANDYMQGRLETAYERFIESLNIAKKIKDRRTMANTLRNVGGVLLALGKVDESIDYMKQSKATFEAIGDRTGLASALSALGEIISRTGDDETSQDYYTQALKIQREVGNKRAIGLTLNNLGSYALQRDDYDTAATHYQEALQVNRDIDDKNGIAMTLTNLGVLEFYREDYDTAIIYFAEAQERAIDLNERNLQTHGLIHQGMIYARQGELTLANNTLQDCLKILLDDYQSPARQLTFLLAVAELAITQGDLQNAVTYLGLVIHHENTENDVKRDAEALLATLDYDETWVNQSKESDLAETLQTLIK